MTVISIWSPEVGKAWFLPPQAVRETKHRTSKAGSSFPEEHRKSLSAAGLGAVRGMKAYDTMRVLNHALTVGVGLNLMWFASEAVFRPMDASVVRFWSNARHRWVRKCARTGAEESELDDCCLLAHLLPMLVIYMDQESSNWLALHYLSSPAPLGGGILQP